MSTIAIASLSITESMRLTGVRWSTYEALLHDLSPHRRLRLTYFQGTLDIMVPSPEHELYKETLGKFVETIAEEFDIDYYPLGSTTFQLPDRCGTEPDKSYYICHPRSIPSKRQLQLDRDPPPDLVVEVDLTRSSKNRLEVMAQLGVLEVWRYDGRRLAVYHLEEDIYVERNRSLAFPNLAVRRLSPFLSRAMDENYLNLVREFRTWVRRQIPANNKNGRVRSPESPVRS